MEARWEGIVLCVDRRQTDGRAGSDRRALQRRQTCGAVRSGKPWTPPQPLCLRCERGWAEVSGHPPNGRRYNAAADGSAELDGVAQKVTSKDLHGLARRDCLPVKHKRKETVTRADHDVLAAIQHIGLGRVAWVGA